MKTDQELADDLKRAALTLNNAIQAAVEVGLQVHVNLMYRNEIPVGQYAHVAITVSRPL